MGTPLPVINGAVEGQQLLERLGGYNNAARFSPWLVLVDLDRDADCPPPFVAARSSNSLRRCLRCLRRLVRAETLRR
jgi:hypothetical protein